MPKIPKRVFNYLTKYPMTRAPQLRHEFGCSGRSSRRWVQYFKEGIAEPYEFESEQEASSVDFSSFLSTLRDLQEIAEDYDPVLNLDEVTFKEDRPIGIMFTSCLHLGSRYVEYDLFEETLEEMLKVPDLYWASLGDDIEGFVASFRDADAVYSQLVNPRFQQILLERVLAMITAQGKLLLGCGSQHGGKWIQQRSGINPVKQAYLNLKVPFYDGTCYLKTHVGEQTYNIALSHEFKGSSQTNPSHPQMRALRSRFPLADVVVMGDKHTPVMQRVVSYPDEFKAGNKKSQWAWLLQAGTTKTGNDKYTITNWSNGEFGWPIVILYPDRHEVDVTFRIQEAREKMGV